MIVLVRIYLGTIIAQEELLPSFRGIILAHTHDMNSRYSLLSIWTCLLPVMLVVYVDKNSFHGRLISYNQHSNNGRELLQILESMFI